jgi:DNA-binding MarR family transcriptional regulator
MRSYIELITHWETFLEASPTGSLEDFGHWLVSKTTQSKPSLEPDLQVYFDANTQNNDYSPANSEAAYLIWRLSKFVKRYTKLAFTDLDIINQDEFAILAHVEYLKECTKRVAVDDNLIEMSSGIDMIGRMVKRGLLIERANPTDKREKLISLTTEGATLLGKIYQAFSNIPDILVDMSDEQKWALVEKLKSLDDYHTRKL